MAEVKIQTTERQITDFREKLCRIMRQVDLIKEGKIAIKDTGKDRLVLIRQLAKDLDEQCKVMPTAYRFNQPTYKDINKLPNDVQRLYHKGISFYQKIMNYEQGIVSSEEFISEMRKTEIYY